MAKVKKHDTFIDMTAMSDVTVLLLTFFMLTATFKPQEPVEVLAPASVSETKVRDYDVLTILIDGQGHVFLNMDREEDKIAALQRMAAEYQMDINQKHTRVFAEMTHVGVPMRNMQKLLEGDVREQGEEMVKQGGVPIDSLNNELAKWVRTFRAINKEGAIAIKADANTPYPQVDRVLKTLVEIKENRYDLVTVLRAMPEGL